MLQERLLLTPKDILDVFQKNTELPADRTLLRYRQWPVTPSHSFPASTAGEDEDHVVSGAADLRFLPGRQRHSRGALFVFFFSFCFSTRNA